ncbi:helix-turn-helix transcriptional regulator [Crassaminicella indica]|uniref:WYL domain-containing protein n=1 Tax=Crassaminicella indica TaxID=2855394 RepID=A0ABX8R8K4_9CLOT|nr:WYL domain-containing protein [Crassaminicella indica]QXM05374.1 WYL domain-containing protein [Crassaminicella indica]
MSNTIIKNVVYALKIIEVLKFKGRQTMEGLADYLYINEDKVKRLIGALRKVPGIDIKGIKGPHGGYELILNTIWDEFFLDEKELEALVLAHKFIKKESGFYLRKEYEMALDKIRERSNMTLKCVEIERVSRNKDTKTIGDQEIENVRKIEKARDNCQKIKIKYFSVNSKTTSVRIIHPYNVYYYDTNGDFYLVGYCEKRKEKRDFKIKRIKNIEILEERFKSPVFDFSKYTKGCYGLHRGEVMHIKLKISYPFNVFVKEDPVVENQIIQELNDNEIIFEGDMSGEDEIITWILSMGKCAKVLEPVELREKVIQKIKESLKSYEE